MAGAPQPAGEVKGHEGHPVLRRPEGLPAPAGSAYLRRQLPTGALCWQDSAVSPRPQDLQPPAAAWPWAGRARSCCCLLPALVRDRAWHLPCPTGPPGPAAVGTCSKSTPGCGAVAVVSCVHSLRSCGGEAPCRAAGGHPVGWQRGGSGAGRAGTAASAGGHPVHPQASLRSVGSGAVLSCGHEAAAWDSTGASGCSQGPGPPLTHGPGAGESVPGPAGAAGEGRSLPRPAGAGPVQRAGRAQGEPPGGQRPPPQAEVERCA